MHRLNEVIYESEWVHLIRKKNVKMLSVETFRKVEECFGGFGYIRRPYGQGEK
jgi:hypothetical protein